MWVPTIENNVESLGLDWDTQDDEPDFKPDFRAYIIAEPQPPKLS